jgi:hypothetical protein
MKRMKDWRDERGGKVTRLKEERSGRLVVAELARERDQVRRPLCCLELSGRL